MAATETLKWAIVMTILVLTALSINCVSGGQDGTISNNSTAPANITITPGPTLQPTISQDNNASIEPTRLNLSANHRFYDDYWIAVQLYYMGEPLRKKGVYITYDLDNDALASLSPRNGNTTDESGSTWIQFYSSETGHGKVKVTVYYNGTNGVISNSTYINITNWGGIGGLVFDKKVVGIPNANVSLWNCNYNDSDHQWEKDNLLDIPENPQLTNTGRTGPSGQYVFYGVPAGTYIVMAEKDGHKNSSIVTIYPEDGVYSSSTGLITLSDYELNQTGYAPMDIPTPTLNGGMIWGIVSDQNKVSALKTNVSLWHCEYNPSTKQWDKTNIVDVPGNPQYSDDGKSGIVGEYRFDNLSQGTYYVLAQYEGHYAHAIVHLNSNLASAYIILQGFFIDPPPTPSPTPRPSTT